MSTIDKSCYFCRFEETAYCNTCKKYLCKECRDNYPKRIKEWWNITFRGKIPNDTNR